MIGGWGLQGQLCYCVWKEETLVLVFFSPSNPWDVVCYFASILNPYSFFWCLSDSLVYGCQYHFVLISSLLVAQEYSIFRWHFRNKCQTDILHEISGALTFPDLSISHLSCRLLLLRFQFLRTSSFLLKISRFVLGAVFTAGLNLPPRGFGNALEIFLVVTNWV